MTHGFVGFVEASGDNFLHKLYRKSFPPKTNISPEKCCLEDSFPFKTGPFSVDMFILRGEINASWANPTKPSRTPGHMQTTIHGTLAGGSITFGMSNIKPVSCGKTELEFEFKDEGSCCGRLPVIEIRFYLPAHLLDIFHESETQMASEPSEACWAHWISEGFAGALACCWTWCLAVNLRKVENIFLSTSLSLDLWKRCGYKTGLEGI